LLYIYILEGKGNTSSAIKRITHRLDENRQEAVLVPDAANDGRREMEYYLLWFSLPSTGSAFRQ